MELKYEDAAIQRVKMKSVWVCSNCHKEAYSEDLARRCCATDVPCSEQECSTRIAVTPHKGFTIITKHCDECKNKERQQRYDRRKAVWQAREKQLWDGKALLYSDSDDRYFYDLDELYDYYDECVEEGCIQSIDDLQIRICQPTRPPGFELEEYLCDYLPDDWDGPLPGAAEVEKVVNEYLESRVFSWEPGPFALLITDKDLKAETYPSHREVYVSPFDGEPK